MTIRSSLQECKRLFQQPGTLREPGDWNPTHGKRTAEAAPLDWLMRELLARLAGEPIPFLDEASELWERLVQARRQPSEPEPLYCP
jgi:hypothetical protein